MSSAHPIRILYLGVTDPGYPRNRRIREAFATWYPSVRIDVVRFRRRDPVLVKLVSLVRHGLRLRRYDLIVLAEFSLEYALVARLAAWTSGASLLVDWFVGMHETRVEDRGASS